MPTKQRLPYSVVLIVVLTTAGICAELLGCAAAHKTRSIEDVEVRKHRWYVDDSRAKVLVVGEVTNTGKATVVAVEVRAILRDHRGSARGENGVVLEDLQPGEVRVFDLEVTRHGGTATVTLELKQPEAAP